jgi:hypothetical protein
VNSGSGGRASGLGLEMAMGGGVARRGCDSHCLGQLA